MPHQTFVVWVSLDTCLLTFEGTLAAGPGSPRILYDSHKVSEQIKG